MTRLSTARIVASNLFVIFLVFIIKFASIYIRYLFALLIGWQAYRETTDTGKTALHNHEVKSKQSKKITCRAYNTFKIGLTADFGQISILEIQVPGLLETSNFV